MTKVIRTVDTIDFEADKSENPAQHEDVLVGWQGKWVKLDMSHAHYTEYDELLGHLLKIGDPVKPADAPKQARTPSGRRSVSHGGRRSNSYYEGLRKFIDDNRISKRDGTGRPAYETTDPRKKFDYPDWAVAMYDEYLAKEDASGEQAALAS